MKHTIDPDQIANAARRISAQIVADQRSDVIFSIIGQRGPELDLESPEVGIVVVARKGPMITLLNFLTRDRPKSVAVVSGDDKIAPAQRHREDAITDLIDAAETVLDGAPDGSPAARDRLRAAIETARRAWSR